MMNRPALPVPLPRHPLPQKAALMIDDPCENEPYLHLMGAMDDPDHLQKASQGQLVALAKDADWVRVPWKNIVFAHSNEADSQLIELGFELGEQLEDNLWRNVRLPEGWSLEGSSHAMYSFLVDEQGYRRGQICFKASGIDRDAFMVICAIPETRAQADSYNAFYAPGFAWVTQSRERVGADLAINLMP